jgi:uncharacterized membrane protein
MKPLPEKEYRSLFEITVILKGIIALGEIILGVLLAFVSYGTLRGLAMALFGNELIETPPRFYLGLCYKRISRIYRDAASGVGIYLPFSWYREACAYRRPFAQ